MPSPANDEWTAPIMEWNREKGYGFLQVGERRLFLHRRELVGLHRTPVVGDVIRFRLGLDAQGRACAVQAVNARGGLGLSLSSVLPLPFLLVLPVIGALHLGVPPLWLGLGALVINALTYSLYASDKRRAGTGQWRVPESHLHLLELLGGWPTAWIAQRRLRHKCSKRSYQAVFILIVLTWQFAAYDSLHRWELSRAGWKQVAMWLERREHTRAWERSNR
ncbi:MAG: DUF1294 domain-containing protein [Verrucomicrobiaceae bacterium]|nr:DUF1294 domain-containing protein [Verrucomicrobiaceae bacterium]